MTHDLLDFVLGLTNLALVSFIGWFIRKLATLEKAKDRNALRIARLESAAGLDPIRFDADN